MASPARPDPVPAGLPSILVVEDEVLVRLAIAEYLRDCGFKVFEASDVAEAKAVLDAETSVGLVFSDLQMPGTSDGFSLAKWVRERHPTVAVILTSGLDGAADKARELCHEGPMIPKPYDHEDVRRRIEELLRAAA